VILLTPGLRATIPCLAESTPKFFYQLTKIQPLRKVPALGGDLMKTGFVKSLAVGTVGLIALVGLVTIGGREAIGQIRAALVKNVDEPGRTPYKTISGVLPGSGCFSGDCTNFAGNSQAAQWDLPAVPAGKRLVVEMVSGGLTEGSTRTIQVELRNGRGGIVFDNLKWIFSGPYSLGSAFSSSVFSEQLFTTFEPGETPTFRVSALPNLGGYFVIKLEGYLIDATN